MNKSRENTTVHPHKENIVDTSAEHVRELEDELLKLRIENAFLIMPTPVHNTHIPTVVPHPSCTMSRNSSVTTRFP